MLKFRQPSRPKTPFSSSPPPPPPSSSAIPCEPCAATAVIKNIAVPLAWPAGEYFENRGEWREYHVRLSFKALGAPEQRSVVLERVDRTVTDLRFQETFTFPNLSPDFTIEAMLSAVRVESTRTPTTFQTVASTVSRSFGRRFGAAFRKTAQMQQTSYTISAYNFPSREDLFGVSSASSVSFAPAHADEERAFVPVARCFFRLENAGLSGKTRVYSLALVSPETAGVPRPQLLPLFGTMVCQVLCRPACLQGTLVRHTLDVFYVDEQLLLERLDARLEGGCVRCFTRTRPEEAALVLPVDRLTQVRPTAYQTAVRITLRDGASGHSREFILILATEAQVRAWVGALQQQWTDANAWGEFASLSTNPFALSVPHPTPTQPSSTAHRSLALQSSVMRGHTLTDTDVVRVAMLSTRRDTRPRVQSVFKEPNNNEPLTRPPEPDLPAARPALRSQPKPQSALPVKAVPPEVARPKPRTNPTRSREPKTTTRDVVPPNTYVIRLCVGLDSDEETASAPSRLGPDSHVSRPPESKASGTRFHRRVGGGPETPVTRSKPRPVSMHTCSFDTEVTHL